MAQKRKIDQSQLILEAALTHADKVGWNNLTIGDIAKKCKLKEVDVAEMYSDIWEVLSAVLVKLDEDTLHEVEDRLSEDARDNLFEVLMTRFDLIEKHRAAFASLLTPKAIPPQKIPLFGKQFLKSMQALLDISGFLLPAPAGGALMAGVYLSILRTWKGDESADLSKTMAAIDKHLDKMQKFLSYGQKS